MMWLLILLLGLIAGTIGGVVGFGASAVLMPVLVWSFGPKEVVPIIAIAGLMANLSRVAVWWREVDWRVNSVYCAAAVPAAVLGAQTMVQLESRFIEGAIGAMLLAMIPLRRWLTAQGFRIGLPGMALVGAVFGFLGAIVASTGPLNTSFFLAYGLVKGGFIATEALGSAAIGLTKSIAFQRLGALPQETLVRGLLVGSSLMVGSWFSKRILQGMDAAHFRTIVEAVMGSCGAYMLWTALV